MYVFEIFLAYLLGTKVIVLTNHAALHYLIEKKYENPWFIRWELLFQEFEFEVIDRRGCENKVAEYLSILEGKEDEELSIDINDNFPTCKSSW